MNEPADIEAEIGLPFSQIYSVWKDLYSALQGKNSFGGTVAEIYAYRLIAGGDAKSFINSNQAKAARDAAATLTKLLREFAAMHPCTIRLCERGTGSDPYDPRKDEIKPFDHRIHIEILPPQHQPDVARARRAWVEIGKALDSAMFQPPKGQTWIYRAAEAMIEFDRAVYGGDIYELVSAAFNVSHNEAKERLTAAAYGRRSK